MDELKEKLAALGLPTEQIDSVLETVLGYLKDQLPEGMSGIVDSLIAGEAPDLGELGGVDDIMNKAKGLFGG